MSEIEDKLNKTSFLHFVIVGLVLSAVYYFNYFDGGESLTLKINNKTSKLENLKQELNDIESLTANYEKYQEELSQLSKKFEVALDYLPSRENVYVIIRQLNTVAKTAGVNITSIKPGEQNVQKDFYEEMPIQIQVEGGYVQLLTFLSKVVNLPRIINLIDVEINNMNNASTSKPILKLKGKMVAYRYVEKSERKEEEEE